MKNYTWLLLSAGLFAVGCDSDKDSGDVSEPDSEPTSEPSSEPETDEVPITDNNGYSSYSGWESMDYNDGSYPAGEYNCQLVWGLSGSAVGEWYASDCDNCEFLFDVTYSLQSASYVYDDGTCLGGGDGSSFGTYGYSSSFDSYGASWVYGSYGTYYWWGYGDFSSDFTYWYGYVDYPYNGVYYTYYQYGSIGVQ